MTCLDTVSISLGVKNNSMPVMFIEYHLNTHSYIERSRYLANLADLARLCVDTSVISVEEQHKV